MKNIVYYIAIATVLLFASCASELDTEPSGSQVSDEQLGELIKENADLVLAPMMQGAVNYMHTGNRQATTNDRGFMVWNLGMDLQGNDMVLTKLTNWFADEYMFESIRPDQCLYGRPLVLLLQDRLSVEPDPRPDPRRCYGQGAGI